MICTGCGTKTQVFDSRPRDGGIWRRRICPQCETKYTTMEHVVDVTEAPEPWYMDDIDWARAREVRGGEAVPP